ncbi:MFS transporter [Piscinibacter koreensis]|uniref:MFS transporter n=1 Tax=Piscinibacter koreensis TaxID=2742824 RepID=A0A7Y6NN85_9BURK|nr:MFS transporter [Schlegelella koreensis]NUZ06270.1 MFS transporter [Schlegelella koreensis]
MNAPSPSTWGTLRHRPFLGLWLGGGVYFIGNAMQVLAAAWMMIQLTGSDFLAAAVQTAVFLPMFLLALPGGVLADTTDRRRLMLAALLTHAAAGALLATLLFTGWAGPGTVMFLIFIGGCCTALMSPAYNSAVAETVPRGELPAAVTLIGIAYNAARAVGPVLAGLVFLVGGSWNFVFAVAGTLLLAYTIRRWPPAPHPPSRLPAERLWGGILSGLRFARHSAAVLAQLVRTAAFAATGSALWALLPVIGQRKLGLDAAGVGVLMGCLGAGAVTAGLVLGRVRARVGLERLVQGACVAFAAATLVAAYVPWLVPVYAGMFLAGAAWMSAMSTFNTATQTSAPPWVRARAVALHVLSSLGSFAIGSAVWGALSGLIGLTVALTIAATLMTLTVLLARLYPLRMGEAPDVTQVVTLWDDIGIADEPAPEAGPVAVEIGYRVRPDDVAAFLDAATQLRGPRRRDGATFWRLYRDLAEPTRYVERFIVTSWADYLHQRARATLADQELEALVRSYLEPGATVTMQHYLAER